MLSRPDRSQDSAGAGCSLNCVSETKRNQARRSRRRGTGSPPVPSSARKKTRIAYVQGQELPPAWRAI